MDDANTPRVLSFQLLNEITNGFSKGMKVGEGSYGKVYKGEYKNGEMIAVKVLRSNSGLDDEDFEKEYQNLASLQHKNIVQLVGYCHETKRVIEKFNGKNVWADIIERALCFEYMQNGNLDRFLADESNGYDWRTRYAIIKGICQGLEYLHEELDPPMYHLDLKPANVLLDENMVPKIADFGLSRLFGGEQTQMTKSVIGTRGYMPPEYIDMGIISNKFDIFSLGVVIIKIMTGPEGYFRSAEMSPEQFVQDVHANWKNKLQTTSVLLLGRQCKQIKRCIEIAISCVDADRRKRPSIGVIINLLNETEKRELQMEMARPQRAVARTMAVCMDLEDAQHKAVEDAVEQSNPGPLLSTELEPLNILESQEIYEAQCRPYVLVTETSHARRHVARGGDVDTVRLFSTPRMDEYLEQAKQFEKNPAPLLPSAHSP